MNLTQVTIANLKPHPDNPNTHPGAQIDALGDSLAEFDQVKNVVIWNDLIIAGHALVISAAKAGRKTLQAIDTAQLGWSKEKATAFMLTDIRLPDMGLIDDEAMIEALKGFEHPTDIPGFDEGFLADIGFGIEPEDYSEFDEQLEELQDYRDINITITIPARYENEVKEWLANGEGESAPGMGKGVLVRCGLL